MKVGIIDMGSNTFRLVIFEVSNGKFKDIDGLRCYSGIINYVQDGCLSVAGMDMIVSVLEEMKVKIKEYDCAHIYCFATASLRNLKNTQSVLMEIKKRTDISVEYLTGQREAFYDFVGLTSTRNLGKAMGCDIGGGSGQIFTFNGKKLLNSTSLPIGCLANYNRFVKGVLPTAKERKQIARFVSRQLDMTNFVKNAGYDRLYIMGGTARALGKIHRGMLSNKEELEGYTLTVKDISTIYETIDGLKMEGVRLLNRFVPARAHTVVPGMIALETIAKYAGVKEIIIVKSGIREGYLTKVLEHHGLLEA